MTKHTPEFSYLRGLKPLVFSVEDCANTANSRRDKDYRIAELEAALAEERAKVERLRGIIQAAIECRMVPVTSAKEGGAAKFSRQVQVADMMREALAATGPTISKTETVED